MQAAQIAARDTDRRFPVRVKVAVPPTGLGKQLTQMQNWLGHNAGSDDGATTPSSERGVLNDALSIHFGDATIASAFLARWCIVYRPEPADGVYRIRKDEPRPRVSAPDHKNAVNTHRPNVAAASEILPGAARTQAG